MSELTNERRRNFRRELLISASALALTAYISSTALAKAEDSGQQQIWIELGGQFEMLSTKEQSYVPPFFAQPPSFTSIAPQKIEKPLDSSFGADGKISFQPKDSDWIFSAGIRYGRSNGYKNAHQSKPLTRFQVGASTKYLTRTDAKFADAASKKYESHEILDFQAGKDLGLGIFGSGSQSVVNFGLRIAQFDAGQHTTLGLDPDNGGYKYLGSFKLPTNNPHTFRGEIRSTRSFQALGPSASWDGSVPFAGNSDNAEITFDWGINAAILFGRQKAKIHHQTTAHSHPPPSRYTGTGTGNHLLTPYRRSSNPPARSRSVTVPNIGGMAGLSVRYSNAKVSLGYRADFFFGAMDEGIDAADRSTIGFHGPFASVSIGLP